MTQHVDTAVRRTITVAASQLRAFEVFTAQLGSWWPKEFHIGEADMADFVLEPKVGGRWYELGVDGKECDTGRVTAFEPPDRLTLAWHLNANWQYDPDPAHASEVEVRFIAEGPTHRFVSEAGGGLAALPAEVPDPQLDGANSRHDKKIMTFRACGSKLAR